MNSPDVKQRAKALLSKNYGYCLAVTLIMSIGSFLGGGVNFSTNINTSTTTTTTTTDFSQFQRMLEEFFSNPFVIFTMVVSSLAAMAFGLAVSVFVSNQLKVGAYRFFLKNRKNHPADIKTIFSSYTDKTFLNIATITLVRDIIVGIGYMLFWIPGIVLELKYFAVDYILAVRPDISRQEAFDLSKRLMNGKKADLFCLELSFIGWGILSIFTCGILAVFYVTPYIELTLAEFYSDLRLEAINKGIITPNDIPDYEEYVDPAVGFAYNNAFAPQQGFNPNMNMYTATSVQNAEAMPVPEQGQPNEALEKIAEPIIEEATETVPEKTEDNSEPIAPEEPEEIPDFKEE